MLRRVSGIKWNSNSPQNMTNAVMEMTVITRKIKEMLFRPKKAVNIAPDARYENMITKPKARFTDAHELDPYVRKPTNQPYKIKMINKLRPTFMYGTRQTAFPLCHKYQNVMNVRPPSRAKGSAKLTVVLLVSVAIGN